MAQNGNQYVGWEVLFSTNDKTNTLGIVIDQNDRDVLILCKTGEVYTFSLNTISISRIRVTSPDEMINAKLKALNSKKTSHSLQRSSPSSSFKDAHFTKNDESFAGHLQQIATENDMLHDIMQSLSNRGLDPVLLLAEVAKNKENEGRNKKHLGKKRLQQEEGKNEGKSASENDDSDDDSDVDSDDEEEDDDDDDDDSDDDDDDDEEEDSDEEESDESDDDESSSEDNEGKNVDEGDDNRRIKCKLIAINIPGHNENEIRITEIKKTTKYSKFIKNKIREDYGKNIVVSYDDNEGDRITISSQQDLKLAFREHSNNKTQTSLRLYLSYSNPKEKKHHQQQPQDQQYQPSNNTSLDSSSINTDNHTLTQHHGRNNIVHSSTPRTTGVGIGAMVSPGRQHHSMSLTNGNVLLPSSSSFVSSTSMIGNSEEEDSMMTPSNGGFLENTWGNDDSYDHYNNVKLVGPRYDTATSPRNQRHGQLSKPDIVQNNFQNTSEYETPKNNRFMDSANELEPCSSPLLINSISYQSVQSFDDMSKGGGGSARGTGGSGSRSQSDHSFSQNLNRSSSSAVDELERSNSEQSAPLYWKRGEILGRGAFGKVYAAIDLRTGQWLAVKQVRLPSLMKVNNKNEIGGELKARGGRPLKQKFDPKVLALQQEIALLEDLDHPNIIKYLGTQRTKTKLNIFLEFAAQGSVGSALKKFGALSEFVIRNYTAQILDGLTYLHSKGVIHRDIKASNILVNRGVVKLADFGCSCKSYLVNDASERQHSMTGTTIYMAPEVMKAEGSSSSNSQNNLNEPHEEVGQGLNNKEEEEDYQKNKLPSIQKKKKSEIGGYGRKADIWSLGMMVLEMAWGKPPYSSPGVAIYKVCMTNEIPPCPNSFSKEGEDFISKCLQRNPFQRPDAFELRKHEFCKTNQNEINTNTLNTMLQTVRIMDEGDQIINQQKNILQHPNNDNDGREAMKLRQHKEEKEGAEDINDSFSSSSSLFSPKQKNNNPNDQMNGSLLSCSTDSSMSSSRSSAVPWGLQSQKDESFSQREGHVYPLSTNTPRNDQIGDFSQSSSGWGSFGFEDRKLSKMEDHHAAAKAEEEDEQRNFSGRRRLKSIKQDEDGGGDEVYEDDFEECDDNIAEEKI